MSEVSDSVARSLALEKAYVHQVYQQISDATDTLPDRGRAWPKVKQFLSDLEPGSLVCDVGCGNGKYLDVNPSIFEIGVDRCKRLTEVAREKDHEVLICDNLALPFRDESFDAVLSIAVVHHFATTDRRVQALRELARVLKIGGKLIISVWAMEQRHRKFESQDVLVPWHKPQQLSTPSLEFTSTTTTTTTTTSEDDGPPPYHAYTQTSDSESTRSQRGNSGVRKRGRHWPKGRSIDPSRPLSSSQSSSSLSSPNETCYSFVRRALQKLAGGKRGSSGRHRPWFLDTWTTCTKEPPPRRYDPDGCEDIDAEDIQDLPIELRRLEEETDLPLRMQTFVRSQKLSSSIDISLGYKSKSLTDILTVNQKCLVRSRSSASNLGSVNIVENGESAAVIASAAPTTTTTTAAAAAAAVTTATTVISSNSIGTALIGKSGSAPPATAATQQATVTKVLAVSVITSQPKPKLVKQKQSLCEEEMEEESGDLPTDMKDLVKRLPEFKVAAVGESRKQGNVFKQSSMNEELMSTERLREKEIVRQNIQKQASLNEEFLFRRQRTFDSIRDSFFSTSTARRFQILKDGLTNKIKSSTTGIEKVAGASFKNGFVRILQGWKSEGPGFPGKAAPATPPPSDVRRTYNFEEKTVNGNGGHCAGAPGGERRHSKEDGSDSSKDSSLQSDTSVDSEDSFASVIFIPKPDQTCETSPPTNTSPPSVALTSPTFHSLPQSPQPTSPKFKGSLPPSPKFKYHSPTSPIIKQPSLPCKYQSPTSPNVKTQFPTSPLGLTKQHSLPTSPKYKYSLPPLSPSLGNKTNDAQLNFQQKLNQLTSVDKSSWMVPPPRQNSSESVAAPLDRSNSEAQKIHAKTQHTRHSLEEGEIADIAESKKASRDDGDIFQETRDVAQAQTIDVATMKASVLPRQQCFPIVRRPMPALGSASRQENLAKPLPKLLSLELFNPETDDVDSDSSGVSSPDSISSVISVLTEELSAESHVSDIQHAKRSPSDGHSNSNSANDSDLNLSDQSLSSLPNSKSPELTYSKIPESVGKCCERIKMSDPKKLESLKPVSCKQAKSPDNLSSSSDSLSKSPDMQRESEDSTKADPSPGAEDDETVGEQGKSSYSKSRSSQKSPDLLSVKRRPHKQVAREGVFKEIFPRKRDEKFVAAACETNYENESNSSPRRNLIEAAADVVSSLEGAVDAVIRSSPRAKRHQLDLLECADSKWVVEDYACAAFEKEDPLSNIFKKCELKQTLKVRRETARNKSPEYVPSHDEPYPDFKFCKIKCHEDRSKRLSLDRHRSNRLISIESVPLLGSYESDGGQGRGGSSERCECEFSPGQRADNNRLLSRDGSRRELEIVLSLPRSIETGSSWSLGRSERFYHSLMEAEREETRRNSSTWSLNRYRSRFGDDHSKSYLLKGKRETNRGGDSSAPCESSPAPASGIVREVSSPADGSCRSTRSHSLSGLGFCGSRADDRLSESWGEEYRQNLANFADKLSKKLSEEIDHYREETDSKHIYSSLPSGLERAEDPYLERLSAQLVDLNRLSAELRERNTCCTSSFSDEDANPEFSKSTIQTNPFLPCSLDGSVCSHSLSARANPFLGDDSESERSKSDDSDVAVIKNFPPTIPDSFVPLEIDSPPKEESENVESRKSETPEEKARQAADRRLVETVGRETVLPDDSDDRRSVKSSGSWKPSRDKRKNLLFVKSASLDDSYRFLGRSGFDRSKKTREDEEASTAATKTMATSAAATATVANAIVRDSVTGTRVEPPAAKRNAFKTCSLENSCRNSGKTHSAESGSDSVTDCCAASRKSTRMPSWESSVETDPGTGLQRDLSKMTISSSLGYSMESSDPEASGGTGSGSDCSRRDASRVTASTTSLGHSVESSDPGDVSERTGSGSDFSRKETSSAGTGPTADSTASFGHESGSDCSKDTGYGDRRVFRCDARSSSEETPRRVQLVRQKSTVHEPVKALAKTESLDTSLNGSTSQESLPSDNGGGAITFHRYYHVFREGELDQLIEKYVDNLHIISSYYDHANCPSTAAVATDNVKDYIDLSVDIFRFFLYHLIDRQSLALIYSRENPRGEYSPLWGALTGRTSPNQTQNTEPGKTFPRRAIGTLSTWNCTVISNSGAQAVILQKCDIPIPSLNLWD